MPIIERKIRTALFNLNGVAKKIRTKVVFRNKIREIKSLPRLSNPHFFLSVAAILKDESAYIVEWIEYHLLIGVEHFYLFNNDSTDGLHEVIKKYVDDGVVTIIDVHGQGIQLPVYREGIEIAKNETEWLAVLDLDEFLVNVDPASSILDFLEQQPEKISQILVGWMIFGSSGLIQKENGLVIDRFRMHADNEFIADYKPIVRPNRVLTVPTPHWMEVFGTTIDETGKQLYRYPNTDIKISLPASKSKIRINHYYSKSLEEFENKIKRGDVLDPQIRTYKMNDFKDHDQNVVQDSLLDELIKQLKLIMTDESV